MVGKRYKSSVNRFRAVSTDSTFFLFTTLRLLLQFHKYFCKMSSKYNFNGKVALVTGSSSGIGAVVAIQLAKVSGNFNSFQKF